MKSREDRFYVRKGNPTMEKVLIIGPFNEVMKDALKDNLTDQFELQFITDRDGYDALEDADYVILRTLNLTAGDIKQMARVKLIQRWGAGYDTVDIKAAGEKGIPVAVCFGVNSTPVAEMTMAHILAAYRNLVPLTNGIKEARWEREIYARYSHTINGKIVGIIGMGSIGRKVAGMCQAFGARILYYDAYRLTKEMEEALKAVYCPLEELWGKCDIISLHVPLLQSTEKMINRETIAKMKDGVLIVNTAREELIDLPALKEALVGGKVCAAGLDAIESTTVSEKFFDGVENIVLTPHLGGNTADDAAQMAKRCADQIISVSQGESLEPPHLVNGKFLTEK